MTDTTSIARTAARSTRPPGTPDRPWRVVQWATGGVGKASVEAIVKHPDLELVGCWVHSADKHGADVGELVGLGPLGVGATTEIEDIVALGADVVVYAPLMPDREQVATLLRAGLDVVTPLGWFYPEAGGRDAAYLAEACADGGSTLHGTGINPGGVPELLPVVLSRFVSGITSVRGEEFSDIRTYGAPDVVRHIMMFGAPREEALQGPMAGFLTGGFTQSVRMCLDALGFSPDAEIRTTHEVAVATAPIDSPIGVIEPGQVAGQRFVWDAVIGDRVVVRAGVTWLMGEEHLDPAWTFGPEGERFEVEVTGDPSCTMTVHGWHPATIEAGLERNEGIVVTAVHCVNSIPYVAAAEPGIRTYLDLPIVAGRAHPDLA